MKNVFHEFELSSSFPEKPDKLLMLISTIDRQALEENLGPPKETLGGGVESYWVSQELIGRLCDLGHKIYMVGP